MTMLKVGSLSLECIIILLIYLESTFYKEKVSFNKKNRVKSIRIAFCEGFHKLCFPHQVALFLLSRQKLTA